MLKRKRLLIAILIIIVALPFVILLVNKIESRVYNRSYADVNSGVSSAHYQLVKVAVPGTTFNYNFSGAIAIIQLDDTIPKEEAEGYLCYDTVKKQLLVQTEEYVPSKVEGEGGDKRIHYVNINMSGQVTADNNGLYLRDSTAYEHAIILNNRMKPFQRWKDDSQEIYLRHFSMDDFNSHSLNPLRGIGNPTGGTSGYSWSGMGYYRISFNGEALKVKLPCRRGSLLFPEEYDYSTNLSYYLVPKVLNQPEVAFLVYTPQHGPHELYIIKRTDKAI